MKNTMLAAVLHKPEDMRVEEVLVPEIGENEILIAVQRCGICGTDPHIYRGHFPAPTPLIQGHEFSGVVARIGSAVNTVQVGDHVTADINISCGKCFYCRMGQKLFCEEITQIGVHINGAFAQYVKVPESNIYKLPEDMSWEDAAYIEPLACVIRGQERANITMGSTVAIIGAGPMGLVHAQLARLNGASKVIITEMNAVRIEKAKSLGIDHVIDASAQDPVKAVFDLTEGRGADFVIEAVGAVPTYQQAFQMVRRGGVLVTYGAAPANAVMEIKPFEIYSKELTIVGSYAGTYDTWLKAIHLISSKRFKPTDIITKTIPLQQVEDGVREAMTNKDTIKIIVDCTTVNE
ncbi:zinc-dependent alcohol dehydrogenase family protein [Paenibacillus agricola]|uniref:Zinc-dependent alcohol dehydrogenase family protein n=1 Tax=Paenibacillus agricola TaxID=2716264 RepID=A0ABX0JFL8_9BACL|nr:zinc-dependent alcohol dehydrogenase family protein [Paenibacillus agricola]NHN34952.1 zinc-dependent alcohol dehydrogenase family protein [Paenibacillus agricola]